MSRILRFFFGHRFLAIGRWELHFLGLRLRNFLFGQTARARHRIERASGPLYLNVGSGPRGLADESWINVDGFTDRHVEFLIDLSRPLPFPDAAFDGAYCEHVLEHFTRDDTIDVVREILRTLKPGAALRVIVPDGETLVKAFVGEPGGLKSRRGGDTDMDALNSYFRQRYDRQYIYDFTTMAATLKAAGFATVTHAAYRRGTEPLLLDDPKYAWESLYVEAFKAA